MSAATGAMSRAAMVPAWRLGHGALAGAPDETVVAPGRIFGRLEVIEEAAPYRWRGRIARRAWLCRCACGELSVVRADSLRQGHTRSCRCLRDELTGERTTRHGGRAGDARSPAYGAWERLLAAPPAAGVCARWRAPLGEGFRNFLADLGPRPSAAHRLVCRDPKAAAGPGTCGWSNARRPGGKPRRLVELDGQRLSLREAAARHGVPYKLLCKRLERGWPLDRALG